jgi:hypothetical protein
MKKLVTVGQLAKTIAFLHATEGRVQVCLRMSEVQRGTA